MTFSNYGSWTPFSMRSRNHSCTGTANEEAPASSTNTTNQPSGGRPRIPGGFMTPSAPPVPVATDSLDTNRNYLGTSFRDFAGNVGQPLSPTMRSALSAPEGVSLPRTEVLGSRSEINSSSPRAEFDKRGAYSTGSYQTAPSANPAGFKVYYPEKMGENAEEHPVITWGNGTTAKPWMYEGMLDHMASHGFIVVASNSSNTGTGREMLKGVDHVLAEGQRPGSPLYGRVDADKIGATGHSQGGGGAINASHDPRITAVAPIQPWLGDSRGVQAPMFVMSGGMDSVIPARGVESNQFGRARVPTVYGNLRRATHFSPLFQGDEYASYTTAWFKNQLSGDESAGRIFFGPNASIDNDRDWSIKRNSLAQAINGDVGIEAPDPLSRPSGSRGSSGLFGGSMRGRASGGFGRFGGFGSFGGFGNSGGFSRMGGIGRMGGFGRSRGGLRSLMGSFFGRR